MGTIIAPTFPILNITRTDVWLALCLAAFIYILIRACRFQWPDPTLVQNYALVSNSPGGIILILLTLWVGTLTTTIAFCVWVIIRGVDPQNSVVISLLGVLSGTAFGNVNGALFTAMKGLEPHLATSTQTSTTTVSTEKTVQPPPSTTGSNS